ncbi:MAG: hypothetical protein U9R32_05465 [Bacteroidota bacterium]|nr:hypothetical protein [Bacteroidota bacterium]
MKIEKGYLYHVYNQGNNCRRIFFDNENYLFFLKKINIYISPYADVLAWCLMPNHFHLMVFVRDVELDKDSVTNVIHWVSHGMTQSHPVSNLAQQFKVTP